MNPHDRDQPWLNRWRIGVWLLMLTAAGWLLWAMDQPAPSHPAVQWTGVQFKPLKADLREANSTASAAWAPVSLPDSWHPRGLAAAGAGRYQASFDLAGAAAGQNGVPWALRIDHLCAEYRVSLNGRLLSTTLPEHHAPGRMAPELIDLPTDVLRAQGNALTVDVSCLQQGGLSTLIVAPKPALRSSYLRARFFLISLPLALNIAGLAFSLFLLMLWWLRGEDASIGLLGVMTLFISISNAAFYAGQHIPLPPQALHWLHFMAYAVTCTVSGLFVLAFTKQRMPVFRRLLWLTLITMSLLGLVALTFDGTLQRVRQWTDPVLISLTLPTIWVLLRSVKREGLRSMFMFATVCLPLSLTSMHDYYFIRWLGDATAPFWAPCGLPFAIPGIYLVIAERAAGVIKQLEASNQHLEARVHERTSALMAANAAKSDFLAAASHDLRQPMVAIGLIAGLLKDRLRGGDLEGLTGRLSEAVESMDDLLNRLLDLSRLESGAFELSPQRVALQPLFDAIVAHESVAARAKGLRIRMRPTNACVWTDPVLLEQILRNLISNALRYTNHGGVLVAARRRGSQWLIQVWDTGIGIPPEHQQRIFDDFVQLGNPGRNAQAGLGLGLALVKRAAGLLGAEVQVRSTLGQGSRFDILLPVATSLVVSTTTLATRPVDATPTHDEAQPLARRHIVVIEDDHAVRLALERRLSAWGATVTALSSLDEARAWLRDQTRPDLLLTDQRLGDGTGLQAMALMRLRWPGLPAVIVTGDTAPQQLQSLYGCGVPILHKPFRIHDLLHTLEHACQGEGQSQDRPLQSSA